MEHTDKLHHSSVQGLKREIQELSALYEIAKAMNSTMGFEEKLGLVLEILHSKLGMERGTLTLLRPQTQELEIRIGRGLSKAEMERGRRYHGESGGIRRTHCGSER
jgi:Nif-specific regulatory protein